MSKLPATQKAVVKPKLQPFNPALLLWEGLTIIESDAEAWFEAQCAIWSERSHQPLKMTRGVFSRWLLFFARFDGKADAVKNRFGHHLAA
jgi:hypothetical protein